jgi:Family of unknown function (DUF6328)
MHVEQIARIVTADFSRSMNDPDHPPASDPDRPPASDPDRPPESDPDRPPESDRDERPGERLDRNTIELLNELRVAGTGIQVMLAFLLVVPFQQGWSKVDGFERTVYFITLLFVAVGAFLLMAPPIHHRILFRHGEKPFLIALANRLAIAGMICLAFGFVGILLLLSDVVVGGAAPAVVAGGAAVFVGGLWFVLPLIRR